MSRPPASSTVPSSVAARLADRNDRFTKCLARVLEHEGGFNDIPADRGGATNFGISLRFLRAEAAINPRVRGLFPAGPIDVADIRALTREQAAQIYLWCFWTPMHCDALPAPVDGAVFDQAVNAGPRAAARLLQQAINCALPVGKPKLLEDGQIGARTLAAARVPAPSIIRDWMRQLAADRYQQIVRLDPSQRVFLRGWLARAAALGDV
jgi:lysozyme family protein